MESITKGLTMNTILKFLHISRNDDLRGAGRFNRYYGTVLRSGEGYPTADEARKDLNNYDRSFMPYGWPR
ncbi:MAG: hypothetical protein WBA46_09225 [Thermomicrobiales bacterium]